MRDILPLDAPDRIDAFGNRMAFERVDGTEYLRKIVLIGPQDGGIGGTIEINGAPGFEFMTSWNALDGTSYINFDGRDPASQRIESASISMPLIKSMAKAFPASFEYGTAEDLFRIGYAKNEYEVKDRDRRVRENAERVKENPLWFEYGIRGGMFQAFSKFEQILDHFNMFDSGLPEENKKWMDAIMDATTFNLDSRRAEFNYDVSRLKDGTTNVAPMLKSIVYRPFIQPVGFFSSSIPPLIVEFTSGDIVVWQSGEDVRVTAGDLVLDEARSVRSVKSDEYGYRPFVRAPGRKEKPMRASTMIYNGWVDDISFQWEEDFTRYRREKGHPNADYFRNIKWQSRLAFITALLGSVVGGISVVRLKNRAFQYIGIQQGTLPRISANVALFMASSTWGLTFLLLGAPLGTKLFKEAFIHHMTRAEDWFDLYLTGQFKHLFKLVEYEPYL